MIKKENDGVNCMPLTVVVLYRAPKSVILRFVGGGFEGLGCADESRGATPAPRGRCRAVMMGMGKMERRVRVGREVCILMVAVMSGIVEWIKNGRRVQNSVFETRVRSSGLG